MEPDVRKRQFMIWYVLAAVLGILLFQAFWSSYSQVETIPYSEFETLLDRGKVAEVTVGADSVQGTLKEPLPNGKREFFAVRVDPQLAESSPGTRSWSRAWLPAGSFRPSILGHPAHSLRRGLDVSVSRFRRKARLRRPHDRGQVARRGLRGDGHQSDVQGCRRRR